MRPLNPLRHSFILTLATLLLSLLPISAMALQEPRPFGADPRIRTYVYDPNQVYIYTGHYKYQSSIVFDKDETIESILVGDSSAWNMIPSGNRLILKPIDQDAVTNMTLTTNKRTYLFELHAEEAEDIRDESLVFVAQFVYPDTIQNNDIMQYEVKSDESPKIAEHPERYNTQYSISGSRLIAPIKIFDDGEFTYFQFKDINADIPAIFQVDADRNEALINYRIQGDYLVVERVAQRFTLRYGNEVTCVFNDKDPLKINPEALPEDKNKKFLGIF